MKNGITDALTHFDARDNSLTCIETLDPDYATANWTLANDNIDDGVTFDVICGAEARTHWYVATTGSDNSGSGTLASPLANIQTAINATTNGDTVSVAAGTYVENINFNGKNIAVIGADSSNTIIDGDSSGSVVVLNSGEDSTAVLKNFTITNGANDYGGGVWIEGSSPLLEYLIVEENYAIHNRGGGIWFNNSNSTLKYSTIINNIAQDYGGGISIDNNSTIIVEDVIINNNVTHNYDGGGVSVDNSSVNITSCTINGNSATHWGGGIYFECSDYSSGYGRIIDSFIENNTAESNGGGLYSHSADLEIIGTVVSNNVSSSGMGGGLNVDGGNIEIINTTIQGNFSAQRGGGLSSVPSSLYLSRNRIVNNVTNGDGGGIYLCCGTDAEIYNNTIAENSSGSGQANGIYFNGCGGSINIKNSILWNSGDQELLLGPCTDELELDIEYSTIKNGQDGIGDNGNSYVWGDGNITSDPLLEGGHTLGTGSPSVDAGNPHAYFYDCDDTPVA